MTRASDYLNETVLYGGIPVRRADLEAHLDHLGVTGPARLAYGRLPAVDLEPMEIAETQTPERGETDG